MKLKTSGRDVVHSRNEWTAPNTSHRRGESGLSGTQVIDRRWDWLDTWIPRGTNLTEKDANGRTRARDAVWQLVWQWQWRSNVRARQSSVLEELARLVKEHKA